MSLIIEYGEVKSKLGSELEIYAEKTWEAFFTRVNRTMNLVQPLVFIFVALITLRLYVAGLCRGGELEARREQEGGSGMKGNLFRTVTIGHPKKLRKSVFCTIVSYLVNVVPFGVSIEVVRTVFAAWSA